MELIPLAESWLVVVNCSPRGQLNQLHTVGPGADNLILLAIDRYELTLRKNAPGIPVHKPIGRISDGISRFDDQISVTLADSTVDPRDRMKLEMGG